jgi:hypothetical protein
MRSWRSTQKWLKRLIKGCYPVAVFIAGVWGSDYVGNFLPTPFLPKPELVLQLTEIEYWNGENRHVDGSLYFAVIDRQGFFIQADEGDEDANEKMKYFEMQFPLRAKEGEKQYLLAIKNSGGAIADNVTLDLPAANEVKILDADRKMAERCTTVPEAGCFLFANNIAPNELINFSVIAKPGLQEPIVKIKGNSTQTIVNRKHFYIIPYGGWGFEVDGKWIEFPDPTQNKIYYFDNDLKKWTELQGSGVAEIIPG